MRGATLPVPPLRIRAPLPALLLDRAHDCPRCGLHFEREPGYWTGALAINIAFVFAIFIVAFVVILVLTVPDVPVGPTLAVLVPVMVIGPILFYPFSKTLWMSVDYGVLHRLNQLTVAGFRSTRRDRMPSSNSHVASPMMAKSWKSSWACWRNCSRCGPATGGKRPVRTAWARVAEPLEHRVDIEFVAHAATLGPRAPATMRAAVPVRSAVTLPVTGRNPS